MSKILGLDLGTSSIGWALVDIKEELLDNKNRIKDFDLIDGGVRLFKEMVDEKGNSLNAERRGSRSLRKVINRKKRRLIKVIFILQQLGFIKDISSIKSILKPLLSISPYELRKKALDKQLTLEELVKVLLHLAKRRGFRSSAKDQDKKKKDREKLRLDITKEAEDKRISLEDYAVLLVDENKENSIMKGIVLLEMLFEKSQYRTLGEFFYETYQNKNMPQRIRGRFLDRSLLEQEFTKILEKQAEFYPILKEDKYNKKYQSFWGDLRDIRTNIDMLYDAIFEPRPRKTQKHLIGKCPFFKKESRAIKSSLLFQEYALWAKINTIKIIKEEINDKKSSKIYRDCTIEEREKIALLAKEKKEILWKDFRKILGLEKDEFINFEIKNGSQKEKFPGLVSYILLKETLTRHFDIISEEDKEKIIYSFSDGELKFYKTINDIKDRYHLTQEEKEELAKIEFPHSSDYASYSNKLLKIILPYIKDGVHLKNNEISFKEWDILAYLKEQKIIPESKELKGRLLQDQEINQVTYNPRVKKMLFELRKLLKTLMNKYGKEEVQKNWVFKIELARGMKKDEYGKMNQTQQQTFNQQLREEARMAGMKNKEDENRYILWLSQDKNCAYCQNKLTLSTLNGADTEIDHIIPISRIPDDSMDNKVLCCQKCNQEKDYKTPLEAFGDKPQWLLMMHKLGAITYEKTKTYQEAKTILDIPKDRKVLMNYSKFLRIQWTQEDIEEQKEKFSSRQLNETRFGSKEVIKFIEHLRGVDELSIPKDRKILTTKGGFTHRIKDILNINTKEEVFTEDELGQRTPKSLLAIEIINTKEKKEEHKKQRADHRHHFLDAFALTFIGPSFENRVTTQEKIKEELKRLLTDIGITDNLEYHNVMIKIKENSKTTKQEMYWINNFNKLYNLIYHKHEQKLKSYYQDLIEKIQSILPNKLDSMIISHAHNRKIREKLHEETVYGVLNTLPVSYLNKERIVKLSQDKYISKELKKAIWQYIEQHKFLPAKNGESKKEEAGDVVLYAFRRGNTKIQDKYGILPPAIELKDFWDESQHGAYQKDKIPLLKPIYTKRAEPTLKNIEKLADVRDQKKIKDKLDIKEEIEAEEKKLKNKDKKKKKDFIKAEMEECPTMMNEIEKLNRQDKKVQDALLKLEEKGFYDDLIVLIKSQYQFKKVLLLDFASKKFIPESLQDAHKAFDTGSNHHMAVFERIKKDKTGAIQYKEDGINPQIERKGIIITTIDAANRARRTNKPANEKDKVIYHHYDNYEKQYKTLNNPTEWKFIFSLVEGDYIELDDHLLYKINKMSQGEIYCSFITTSSKYDGAKTPVYILSKNTISVISGKKGANSLLSKILHKWYVNPIGDLIKAND